MNHNLKSFLIGMFITLFLAVGGGAAVYIALRTNTLAPVAPTVPQAKPQAAEVVNPSQPNPACKISFTVAAVTAFTCDSVTIEPSDGNVAAGQSRELTANTTGGTGDLTYSWDQTSSGASLGTLSSTTSQTTTWTAPALVSSTGQTWTVKATVKDAGGQTATGDCSVSLTFSPSPPKVCNGSCTQNADCPSGLVCSAGKCRNSACTDQTSCTCPPPSPVCNSRCSTSADCSSGLACSGGSCRNPSCTSSANCVCPVAPPPTPPPAAPQTHKTCRNFACVSVSGAGQDTCTSDVSCAPAAKPQPIPPSGMDLPTIAAIAGGIALMAIGLLVVL